jgi:hypothetical protein
MRSLDGFPFGGAGIPGHGSPGHDTPAAYRFDILKLCHPVHGEKGLAAIGIAASAGVVREDCNPVAAFAAER